MPARELLERQRTFAQISSQGSSIELLASSNGDHILRHETSESIMSLYMEHVRIDHAGPVAIATMQRGKANPLNHALLTELMSCVEQAETDPNVKAFVLASDRPRFFSPGFDVNEVFLYSRDQIAEFLMLFGRLMDRIHFFPKPTVAALSGQTYAGGALLALCFDFRIMAAEGNYGFALTEVNIGVRLPESVFRLLANAAGVPLARRAFLTGDPILPAEGLAAGLYHSLAPEADVRAKSVELASYLTTKPAATYVAIKEKILAATGHQRLDPARPWIDVDAWFTPEAELMKRKLAEKLAAGKA